MHDQPNAPCLEWRGDEVQFTVLALLLERGSPAQWSIAELAREVGCEIATVEAVQRLDAAGLVHRVQEFVFAARPAQRFCQLLRE